MPDEALATINRVDNGVLKDVDMNSEWGKAVYRLYRAGVLTGSMDEGRMYNAPALIRRSEAAAILSRVVDPSLRRSLSLERAYPDHNRVDIGSLKETVGYTPEGAPITHYESFPVIRLTVEDRANYPRLAEWADSFNTAACYEAEKRWTNYFIPAGYEQSWLYEEFCDIDNAEITRFTDRIFCLRYSGRSNKAGSTKVGEFLFTVAIDPAAGKELSFDQILVSKVKYQEAIKKVIDGCEDDMFCPFRGLIGKDASAMPDPEKWALTERGLEVEFDKLNYGVQLGLTAVLPEELIKPLYRAD